MLKQDKGDFVDNLAVVRKLAADIWNKHPNLSHFERVEDMLEDFTPPRNTELNERQCTNARKLLNAVLSELCKAEYAMPPPGGSGGAPV